MPSQGKILETEFIYKNLQLQILITKSLYNNGTEIKANRHIYTLAKKRKERKEEKNKEKH